MIKSEKKETKDKKNKKKYETCQICFTSNETCKLHCGYECCKSCLKQWVLAKIEFQELKTDDVCKCIDEKCDKPITKGDLIKNLDKKRLNKVSNRFLKTYLSNTDDIRKCPNSKCKFAGILPQGSCNDYLVCDKCGTEWMDPSHTMFKNPFEFLYNNKDKQLLTYFLEMYYGESCPNCDAMILKEGGCSHMMCTKCSTNFCWTCVSPLDPGYRHKTMTLCPFHKTPKHFSIFYFLIFSLYYHLYFRFISARIYLSTITYIIWLLLLSGIIVFFTFALLYELNRAWNYRNGGNTRKIFGGIILCEIMSLGILAYFTKFGRDLVMVVLGEFFLLGVFLGGVKVVKYCRERRSLKAEVKDYHPQIDEV